MKTETKLNRTTVEGVPGFFEDNLRSGPFVKTYYYPTEGKRQLVCSVFLQYGNEVNTSFNEDRLARICQYVERNELVKK